MREREGERESKAYRGGERTEGGETGSTSLVGISRLLVSLNCVRPFVRGSVISVTAASMQQIVNSAPDWLSIDRSGESLVRVVHMVGSQRLSSVCICDCLGKSKLLFFVYRLKQEKVGESSCLAALPISYVLEARLTVQHSQIQLTGRRHTILRSCVLLCLDRWKVSKKYSSIRFSFIEGMLTKVICHKFLLEIQCLWHPAFNIY